MTGATRLIRNAAYNHYFWFKTTDGAVHTTDPTGMSSTLSKDGAAAAAGPAPSVVETGTGQGLIALTVANMSFSLGMLKFISTGPRSPEGFELVTEDCIDSGVAQASAAGYIALRAAASAVDDAYNGFLVEIVRGTGSTQKHRLILDYTGSNQRATVWPQWDTTPDTTSVYKIVEAPPGLTNLALFYGTALRKFACAASSTTTSLTSSLTGYGANAFRNAVVIPITANGNQGFDRAVGSYDTATGTFTLSTALPVTPTTGDEFFIGGLIG
jgi:hypothetical protein